MKKNTIIIIIFIIVICYILFSTDFINNRNICKYKHIHNKNILKIEIPGSYKLFNPSLCKYNNNYIMCTRYCNNTAKNLFMYLTAKLHIESHISFIILNNSFNIKKIIFPKLNSNKLEDPRICFYKNNFYISITEFIDRNNIIPKLYIFDNNFNFIKHIEYNWQQYFEQTKKKKIMIQKNFCPFVLNDNLLVHTDSYPIWNVFKIDTITKDSMSFNNIISYDTTSFFKDLNQKIIRCSTSWVNFSKNTLLVGLHTKEFDYFGKIPTIRSILVEVDKNSLKPLRKTNLLCFDFYKHTRIQFLSGLEIDDFYIYLTFGFGDYKVIVKKLTKIHVNNLLY